jgi:tetratricopeptide (TPR) repeat protein
MNCREARAVFSDFHDGTLSGPRLVDLQRHLDDCPACRAEWAAFRRTVHMLQGMGDEEPSSDFAARVVQRIEATRGWRQVVATLVLPLRVKLPIHAAALVVLGLVGLWVSQRSPEPEPAGFKRAPRVAQDAAPDAARPGRLQPAPAPPDARAPASRSADDRLASGAAQFAAQLYQPAIDDLRAFLAQHPDDGRAPDARFLLADAYRAEGRYGEAEGELETFLRQYPRHPKAPLALYRQGEVRILRGDHSGCGILRDALNRYPDAREAVTARETLAARCP